MSRTALALSPHLDDAAFSCGGTLAQLARTGWRVVVATLFTASVPDPSGFALACQLDKGLGPDVDYMMLRRAEDARAMAALGAVPVHLAFREAPHRGYSSAAALFGLPHVDDAVVAPLAKAMRALVADEAPALLLAPQAIGGHVDHLQVMHALRRAGPPDCPTLWWRDFPYVTRTADPPEPFGDTMAALRERTMTLSAADQATREAACLAYASQLGFQFGGADGLRTKLAAGGGVEQFREMGAPLSEIVPQC